MQTAYLAQGAASATFFLLRSSCRLSPQRMGEGNLSSILSSRSHSVCCPLYRPAWRKAHSRLDVLRSWEGLPSFPVDTPRGSSRCCMPHSEEKPKKDRFKDVYYPVPRVVCLEYLTKCRRNIVEKEVVSFLVIPQIATILQQMMEKLSQSRGRLLIPRQLRTRTAAYKAATTDQHWGEKKALRATHLVERRRSESLAENSVPVPSGILEQFPFAYDADAFDIARRPSRAQAEAAKLLHNKRKSFIYFDNAATTQKPWGVLQELQRAYIDENANVHRSTYSRAAAATERLEGVRHQLATYLNAEHVDEIVFTSGATDSINLVAGSWGENNISEGDEIVLSVAEHHSNIVPWQLLATRKHASLKYIGLDEQFLLSVPSLLSSLSPRTKLVALSHTSNVLGSFNPYVREIIGIIKRFNPSIAVLLDASQAVAHHKVDVRELMCDFLVGSGHKMYGPTGVGFLYGKRSLLQEMPPWKGGGEMIAVREQPSSLTVKDAEICIDNFSEVHRNSSTYADPPARFEAGTPAFVQISGLGAALDFMEEAGLGEIVAYESKLHNILRSALEAQVPSIRLFCPPAFPCPPPQLLGKDFSEESFRRLKPLPPVPVISFVHPFVHAQDVATFLDVCDEIYIRSGHHCCQLLHREVFRVPATCRASLAVYNTEEEVYKFVKSVQSVVSMLEREGLKVPHAAPETVQLLSSETALPQGEPLSLHSECKAI